ncbi:ribosome silencing factor [Azohydromonas australica]|uniref:ribosome silencing factor n=1 Tax=Azohydromonas australica TaxID=364039 RepID=UPI000401261F|nr:ribosome silencing factor [Azohydromonas australica]
MDIRKLQRAIVDGLEDVKAVNIVVFNTEHLSPLFERVIIASGTSNRQTKALASSVRDAVKSRGLEVHRTEGEENGEWIIVDCGAAVAHIMQPAIRDYYNLEEIWGEKPVKLKLGGNGAKGLPKASAPDEDDEEVEGKAHASRTARTAAGKAALAAAPVKKTVGKKAPAKKAAAPTTAKAAPAKKAAAKKAAAPAKKAAPARKAVTRTTGSKTAVSKAVPDQRVVVNAPAKKAAAKKVAAKKAPAKTATARTVAAKAPAAKKAPAKKAAAKSATTRSRG